MRLSRSRPAPIMEPSKRFEALRETTAVVGARLRVPPSSRALMSAARLCCQVGGRTLGGDECLQCDRLVSLKPSPGRSFVTIRCLWTEHDVVEDVMTHAHAIVAIRASATLGVADEHAAREQQHHLLVVEHDDVVGTVCRCRLAEPGSRAGQRPVTDAIDERLWTVPPGTHLGAAAEAMDLVGSSVLLVAAGDRLLGMITRRELGVTEQGHGS